MEKLRRSLWLVLGFAGWGAWAKLDKSEDRGFRFDEKLRQCLNADGKEGLNPGYLGECGDLSDRNFSGKKLKNLNLKGADLFAADFQKAKLTMVNLRGANASALKGLRLQFLEGTSAEETIFEGADLTQAESLGHISFRAANFNSATMTGVKFKNANLSESVLTGADLLGADLGQADLSNADLREALFNAKTLLPFPFDEAIKRGMIFKK
jgi:uncharacterized protein YjbI with pentapeptide repeats